MTHQLPILNYDFNALEPYIDKLTMEIHYGKHHQTYVTNLNNALEGHADLAAKPLVDLLANLDAIPEKIRTAVRNNGGGHLNHTLFWDIIKPSKDVTKHSSKLVEAINQAFGNYENFEKEFTAAAVSRFGSGWAWLIIDEKGELKVTSTPNQDNPIMDGKIAILGLDVWEHAYYLNYQNRRADYISNFFKIINWDIVSEKFEINN
ncbi:superoxide dismutase [Paenibacillus sp. 453mf]|uniref:superoxide dismutase n=1 Tax=Paenibacillus sp. 453mf TaxID=1761874 RepID=UPI0008ED5AB1|nr:superoxide dismutase [Paenibacillus sp. 453mf]SFS55422.1 superoxide dismutase, Fe-Mn family [Paenibacillus sp. 453mf]